MMPYSDHLAALDRESARIVAVTTGADPATAVPTTPAWDLAALLKHTGGVHRWFTALLREKSEKPPMHRGGDLGLPEREEDYPAWLSSGTATALEVLGATDPDTPMWTWAPSGQARFWARRMLFETLVHRFDAEAALGAESPIGAELAADGIAEFLVNLPSAVRFAPKVANLRGDGETIHLHATDSDTEWVVTLTPEGFGSEVAHAKSTVAVRGTTADLLLFLYGRRRYAEDRFEVFGDTAVLDLWVANAEF